MELKPEVKINLPFWILTLCLIALLIVPVLIQDGMFMDAVLYTSVSKNMAMGKGTFWFPYFSKYSVGGLGSFHEQPPLAFGIESLFFRLLGNGLYTERIYTGFILSLSILLVQQIWKRTTSLSYAGWLPVMLWIIIPVCIWAYANNIHENTMGVFVLLSVWCFLRSKEEGKYPLLFLILAGVAIMLSSLTKGIPGLFPLAMPLLYGIALRNDSPKKIITETLILILVVSLVYGILMLFPESRESLNNYLFKRALQRIGAEPTVDSRFYIVGALLGEIAVPAILTLVIWVYLRYFGTYIMERKYIQYAFFFFLLGLSGSLPLMLTKVQKVFYFVHAMPYFGLAFGMIIGKGLTQKIQNMGNSRILKPLTLCLMIALGGSLIYAFSFQGKIGREKEKIQDIRLIGQTIQGDTLIRIEPELWEDWHLQTYLMRYFHVSVETTTHERFWVTPRGKSQGVPPNYTLIILNTQKYDLYQRNP